MKESAVRSSIALQTTSLLSFVLAGPVPAPAQGRAVPTIVLDRGAKEFGDPFSQVSAMIELRDGRVLLVDAKEKQLRVVDFVHDVATPVSRVGNGPLEYQVPPMPALAAPWMLLRGMRDSLVYYDIVQRRFLLLSPDAKPVRTVPFGGTESTASSSQMVPAGADTTGRICGQTMGVTVPGIESGAASGLKVADSVDVTCLDRRTSRTTVTARIRNPITQSRPKLEMSSTSVRMTVTAADFRPNDAWALLPDGRVAILRDGMYRVHFIAAGRPETLGPVIQFTPVPVTPRERKALIDSTRKAMDTGLEAMRKTAAGAPGAPTFDAQVIEPPSWATTKPAYTSMQSSPDGRLWVSPSLPTGTPFQRYDVLDGAGALVAHVQLAAGEVLVGLGRRTVYTIRTDEDDLQHLRRYQLPRLP